MANSSITINNLKSWFTNTLAWLNVDRNNEQLENSYQQMLELMEAARNENRPNDVWELIEQLEQLTIQTTSIQEQGEIFLKCAKTAGDLENLREASRLCTAAENKFRSYPHQHAVALWMNGCIHWVSHQRVKAISNWREAINLFKTRKASLQLDQKRGEWYTQMIPKLEIYLEKAIKENSLPVYEDSPTPPAHPSSQASASAPDELKWLHIPVSDSVPAGGFGAVGHDTEQTHLGVTEVSIENERFGVYSFRRNSPYQNTVVVQPTERYHTLRVTGNSMNACKPVSIEDGDYILVRIQSHARDNDIVVASLNDPDLRATVKRVSYSGGRITLRPESHDPAYQSEPELERDYSVKEILISGVVEAVFKKKNG